MIFSFYFMSICWTVNICNCAVNFVHLLDKKQSSSHFSKKKWMFPCLLPIRAAHWDRDAVLCALRWLAFSCHWVSEIIHQQHVQGYHCCDVGISRDCDVVEKMIFKQTRERFNWDPLCTLKHKCLCCYCKEVHCCVMQYLTEPVTMPSVQYHQKHIEEEYVLASYQYRKYLIKYGG